MPAMHLVSTVLPAPLSPHRAVTCPCGMSRSTWYSAWTGPKCLSSPRIFSNGSPAALAWATAAVISISLSLLTKEDAAASRGGLRFEVDGLVDRPTLIVGQHVGDPVRGCILARGRNRLGLDALALEDRDHRVAEAVIGLDRGVDRGVGRVGLLEDRLSDVVLPVRGHLLPDELHALAVGRAVVHVRGLLAPDGVVVALRE